MARVVVVGGGFAGLSVAARLAKLRHEVVLLESDDRLGGRLRAEAPDGEGAWHLSPGTFTLPGVLRDLFRKSGRILDTALTIETVPGRRHVFGEHLLPHGAAPPGAPRTAALVPWHEPAALGPYRMLDLPMGRRSDQVDALLAVFGTDEWTPVLDAAPPAWDVLRRRLLHRLPDGPADLDRGARRTLGTRRSLARLARKDLDDDRVRAMLLDTVRLDGDDPRLVPSAATIVPYLERNFGRWRVVGGPDALADALTRRLEERRVEVRLGVAAFDVVVESGAARSVATDDGPVAADLVVWAAPSWPAGLTMPRLLPRIPAARALVRLGEDPGLPRDVVAHQDPALRLWSEDGLHWTIAHHGAEDPLVALARIGLDLRELVDRRVDLAPAALVQRAHWGWQWHGWRSAFDRPGAGPALPDGLFMVGAHAHSGPSLEQIGLASEAVAEHVGAVPRPGAVRR